MSGTLPCPPSSVPRPRRASVLLHGQPCGVLEEDCPGGPSRFRYLPGYRGRPIAPNLPVRPEPHESAGFHPFFANLLDGPWAPGAPAGLDRFSALLSCGRELVGAVEVVDLVSPLGERARGLLHVALYEAASSRDACRDASRSPHLSADPAYCELQRQRMLEWAEAAEQLAALCDCEAYCRHLVRP